MVKKKGKKINIKTKKDKKIISKETAKTPTVWNPLDIWNNMDRWLWEDPWTPFWRRSRYNELIPRDNWLDRWFDTDTKITTINMIDTGKEFKITAEMPGVDKKDIEINVTPKNISICGETKTESNEKEKGWIRKERNYSTICRSMIFPEDVDPDKADAKLKDGILEITIGKKKPTVEKGKNIPVK